MHVGCHQGAIVSRKPQWHHLKLFIRWERQPGIQRAWAGGRHPRVLGKSRLSRIHPGLASSLFTVKTFQGRIHITGFSFCLRLQYNSALLLILCLRFQYFVRGWVFCFFFTFIVLFKNIALKYLSWLLSFLVPSFAFKPHLPHPSVGSRRTRDLKHIKQY